ncbi:MAG TPA: hypothetical protein VFA65_07175 [Bryobacteraceae bacterium]|nr:hypothetical protein [Bryobacteraceae bacterium]
MQVHLAILLFGIVTAVHAQSSCPWMNAATAGGLLGGQVTAKFSPDGKHGGKCEFVRSPNSDASVRIEVTVMESPKTQFSHYVAECGANGKPVKAIGNEAVACSSGNEQSVVGRVRDQAFVVTLVPARRDGVKKAADIVAGNLF